MLIRRMTVSDGNGAVIQTAPMNTGELVLLRHHPDRLQPQGGRRQDHHRDQPRRRPGQHRSASPARRCRYGDGAHRQLARHGAPPDGRRRRR